MESQEGLGWKVLPSCYLKLLAAQLKLETARVPFQKAAPVLLARVKEVEAEGGHDELNHVFQLRKRHIFAFRGYLLHHVAMAGSLLWSKRIEGKTIFKLADGSGIIDCVFWHKLSHSATPPNLHPGQAVLIHGKPDIYRDVIQVYVTRLHIIESFAQEAAFHAALVRSQRILFSPPSTSGGALRSRLRQKPVYISYLKIRQALSNELARDKKYAPGQQLAYIDLKDRLLAIAQKLAFLPKMKEKPQLLHEILGDLQNMGFLGLISPEGTATLNRVYQVLDLEALLEPSIIQAFQDDGEMTLQALHNTLSEQVSICLSKETVYDQLNRLLKEGRLLELSGPTRYKLLD